MPTRDRFSVTRYGKDEELPPKKWHTSRRKTRYGYEDMPIWQVPLRVAATLAVIGLVLFIMFKVGTWWWDENTYGGYSDCVAVGMTDYKAEYGEAGEGFRHQVENHCSAQFNR